MTAVTQEAIRRHPREFAMGIMRTVGELLRARTFAPEVAPASDETRASEEPETAFVLVNGRKLPRPSEGAPIPASHFGPALHTLYGQAREVWRSPTEHSYVFDDPRDERRYVKFQRDTNRLGDRIPNRDANQGLVHRLNQASRAFPPPGFWLAVGTLALAMRRPQRALVAIAPSVAGLAVIIGTALVTSAVSEYALPVSPAFVLLAAAGLVGARAAEANEPVVASAACGLNPELDDGRANLGPPPGRGFARRGVLPMLRFGEWCSWSLR